MAMGNQLTQKQQQSDNKVTIIKTDTGEIKLSTNIVKSYLVAGNGEVSDQEVKLFIALCSAQKLNPFIKEAHLIKYSSSTPATMVVSKDVFQKRADNHPSYDGKEAGIIVFDKDEKICYRNGAFNLPGDKIIGGWCKIFRKDRSFPEIIEVSFDEYVGKKGNGEINGQWAKKPATMIRKVAVSQALRESFPKEFQGMYSAEEFGIDEPMDNGNLAEVANTMETVQLPQETVIETLDPME